jgi:glutamine cyclotransferase
MESRTFHTTTNEGWGITYRPDTHEFFVSDGSHYLHTWDADTFQETARVAVTFQLPQHEAAKDINYLNELEWDPATNTVLANVWYQDVLLRIHPDTGFVSTLYSMHNLYPNREKGNDAVLNGIALTDGANTDEFWVTGKWWPSMFRVRLVDPPAQ